MEKLARGTVNQRLIVGAVLAVGLLLSVIVWRFAERAEDARIQTEFRRRAEAQARIATERVHLYREMIHGLRNFILGQDAVTKDEFAFVSRDLLQRFPSIQALEWVPRVTAAQRPVFEADATREWAQAFGITTRGSAGAFIPAPPAAEHLPILYVEPFAGNEVVVGYDILTAPTRPVLDRARASGALMATHQFRLAQSETTADQYGVIFVMPLYARPGGTEAEDFLGFVQCVFRVETLLARSHGTTHDEALLFYYVDLDATGDQPGLLYANEAGHEPLRAGRRPAIDFRRHEPGEFRETVAVGGRSWLLLARVNPAWRATQLTQVPGLLLAGGLALTTLGAVLVNTLVSRTRRIEREVAERTAELEAARRLLEEDIRQREEAELRLRESEARLQAILDHSSSPIFVKDLDGRYLLFNQRFADVCGRAVEDIVGRDDTQVFSPREAETFRTNDAIVLRGGVARAFEETAETPEGPRTSIVQKFPLRDARGQVYALGGIVTDITDRVRTESERREMERRLQASQKLESLGVLAGGIAHDFNNILTAILGNASLARQVGGPANPLRPQLTQIEHAARRAADLCQQMLAYAGKGRIVTDRVDLDEIIRGTVALLEVSIGKNITLELDLADGLPAVMADVTQLRQILMNLVINAGDAIGGNAGVVKVRTRAARFDAAQLSQAIGHPTLAAGTYVELAVTDNGCGMSAETVARIFEPFFTTKFSGRGLGLSAVLGIVQGHRGALFVDSTPGSGSTFRLVLPAVEGAAQREASSVTVPPLSLTGTVLIIDDEEAVREVARLALENQGATVVPASSGEEAVATCRAHGDSISLVLLDLTMPGLSGEETVHRLRQAGLSAPIILMSGYSESDAGKRVAHLGVAGFLQKPFELGSLLAKAAPHLS